MNAFCLILNPLEVTQLQATERFWNQGPSRLKELAPPWRFSWKPITDPHLSGQTTRTKLNPLQLMEPNESTKDHKTAVSITMTEKGVEPARTHWCPPRA